MLAASLEGNDLDLVFFLALFGNMLCISLEALGFRVWGLGFRPVQGSVTHSLN
jgi:hypothetical protein